MHGSSAHGAQIELQRRLEAGDAMPSFVHRFSRRLFLLGWSG
jgi:hypothetical protein